MKIEEIQQRASRIITEKLDIDGIGLMEEPSDFGADQLDHIEIVMALEDEFDIEIHDDDKMFDDDRTYPTLKCVEKIAESIAENLNKNKGEEVKIPLLLFEEKQPEEKVEKVEEAKVKIDEKADWREESWDKLRESGLFRFLNMFLHIFGWAIQMEVDDDGKIEKVYPIRCKYDGFSEGDEKMMRKIGTFMKCDEWLRENNDRRFSENS